MSTWEQITSAIGAAMGGDKGHGRTLLESCWADTAEHEQAQRCVIAHYLADTQDSIDDEVRWDERALAAYVHVKDADLAAIGVPSARGMAPSLHLNVGDGYLRQGRVSEAREHLAAGLAATEALGDDGYGALIRKGLAGLQARLAEAEA